MGYVELRKGSKGEQVKRMQAMLIARGYYCGSSGVDGTFGAATLSAVAAFQQEHGLKVDGIAGNKTLRALYTRDYEAIGRAVEKCVESVEKLDDFKTLEVLLNG